jgi:hypothetical protein
MVFRLFPHNIAIKRKKALCISRGHRIFHYFLCKKSGILRDLGSTVLVILVGLFSERGLVADDVAG